MSIQIPDRGDYVYINLNPQAGVEKAGRRSAIVLSPKEFNKKTGFASICPITNTVKEWPFQVHLPEGEFFTGSVETDQVKNLDWKSRKIQVVGKADDEVVEDCLAKIETFLSY